MKFVVFAVLGCCALVNSASLVSESKILDAETSSFLKSLTDSLEGSEIIPIEISEPIPEGGSSESTRTKRSGDLGSGGFLAGIGSAILGKVASASSGISSGSSHSAGTGHAYESVEYGPPVHNYDEKNFDIWSFKKAILNTLFQALKAIGGGVIALKGKLIQGGGVVISTKGSIISAKGEAISSLGRHIAASAVLAPPKTSHYVYHPPPPPAIHVHTATDHDSYGGPLPSAHGQHGGYGLGASDNYGNSGYAAPSDDADHPGLLILKKLKAEESQSLHSAPSSSYESFNPHHVGDSGFQKNLQEDDHDHRGKGIKDVVNHPAFSALAESFGGNQKDSGLGNLLVGKLAGLSNSNPIGKGGKTAEVAFDVTHSEQHEVHRPQTEYGVPEVYENNGDVKSQGTSFAHNNHQQDIGLQNQIHENAVQNFQELSFQQGNQANSFSGHNDQSQYQNYYQVSPLDIRHPQTFDSNSNNVIFTKSLEIPILQAQPAYFSNNNYLHDYGLHNGLAAQKRNSLHPKPKESGNVISGLKLQPLNNQHSKVLHRT
ncbi:uncharacterized protein LOC110116917 [Athalia rosae]|uniref:uncharacterized protein LOC110116917 n=1 Tax=Athalia rosae TaxID=37344 RepID=UPI00203438CA|nr:uncharacterized protein LOC110116917 [Athalia rosae]